MKMSILVLKIILNCILVEYIPDSWLTCMCFMIRASHIFTEPLQATCFCYRNSIKETGTPVIKKTVNMFICYRQESYPWLQLMGDIPKHCVFTLKLQFDMFQDTGVMMRDIVGGFFTECFFLILGKLSKYIEHNYLGIHRVICIYIYHCNIQHSTTGCAIQAKELMIAYIRKKIK